jgi:hypothetical protein
MERPPSRFVLMTGFVRRRTILMMKQVFANIGLAALLCPQLEASRWTKLTHLEVNEPLTSGEPHSPRGSTL